MHSPTVTEGPLAGSQGRQLSTTTGDSGRHTVQPKARIAVTQVSEEGAGLGPGRLPSTRQPGGSERESCVCRRKPTSRGVPAGTVRRPLIREVSGRPSSVPPRLLRGQSPSWRAQPSSPDDTELLGVHACRPDPTSWRGPTRAAPTRGACGLSRSPSLTSPLTPSAA